MKKANGKLVHRLLQGSAVNSLYEEQKFNRV